jgi:hypothetical protein
MTPFNLTTEYVERIAKGDFPVKLLKVCKEILMKLNRM